MEVANEVPKTERSAEIENSPELLGFTRWNPLVNCLRPIRLVDMAVPCGKCDACRSAHANEWALRILHELSTKNHTGSFVTLTYNDENLPKNESLDKEELQKFFKRLRKNSGKIFKYYACGEYGETYHRPHYHICFLGIDFHDEDFIRKSWTFGNIHIGSLTVKSARYVANYLNKDRGKYVGSRKPPFQLQSKGIGLEFALKNEDQIRLQLTDEGGRKEPLPRYYRKKLGIMADEFADRQAKKKLDLIDHHLQFTDSLEGVYTRVQRARRQKSRDFDSLRSIMNDRDY